jgi:serralysin
MDAISQTEANEAFTFIGTNSFSGAAGELRYVVANGAVVVRGDVNGDKISGFAIVVENVATLGAVDFIL